MIGIARNTQVCEELARFAKVGHIHDRKEVENYLLVNQALQRSIVSRIGEQNQRTGKSANCDEDIDSILRSVTERLKHKVHAQYLAKRTAFGRLKTRDIDLATINESVMAEFDAAWSDPQSRLTIVPGYLFTSLRCL